MASPNRPRRRLTDADVARHGELLKNRLLKRQKHLGARFRRAQVEAYRLYDWDIPEVRASVDWYAGHLVAAEYARRQTEEIEDWLAKVMAPAAEALGVPCDKLHLKKRQTGARGERYGRLARTGQRHVVKEGPLQFLVNLDDYIDTGLFADHRKTRAMVQSQSDGRAVLNLYAYTGSFTCYAAHGGAKTTTTVDLSGTYLDWTKDNLRHNKLWSDKHTLVRSDVPAFLAATRDTYDLAIVDPPSFSSEGDFDVLRDHGDLLQDVLCVMRPGGRVYFSTNHQRFEPNFQGLRVQSIEEITQQTVPEDYRNRTMHRCFVIEV